MDKIFVKLKALMKISVRFGVIASEKNDSKAKNKFYAL